MRCHCVGSACAGAAGFGGGLTRLRGWITRPPPRTAAERDGRRRVAAAVGMVARAGEGRAAAALGRRACRIAWLLRAGRQLFETAPADAFVAAGRGGAGVLGSALPPSKRATRRRLPPAGI